MGKETSRTYQTRIEIDTPVDEVLHAFSKHFAHVQHCLFADIASGKDPCHLKNDYLKRFQITARQFNAIRVLVVGKIDAIKKRRTELIREKEDRLQSLQKKIQKIKKKGDPKLLHLKKRRLSKLQAELHRLKQDHEKNTVRLCFGSKKLFRAQFELEANGFANHQEWKEAWQENRCKELFFLGSKDETSGNQSCTATLEAESLALRIRLPDAMAQTSGKYLIIKNIHFKYGAAEIRSALEKKQAITWRILHDQKGWRVFATVDVKPAPCTSHKERGVVGIDINVDHLALAETDSFGNPTFHKTIPLRLKGKTSHQAKAVIGDAAAQAIEHANRTGKPLVIEDLDFQKKKRLLREEHTKKHNQMLSSFCYQAMITHLKSNASKKGVSVEQVNPAYTSIIGRVKFSKRYGFTIHQAAALTIGRRSLECSEKIPSNPGHIPDGKGGHVTLALPVRNRARHVWSHWSDLNKQLSVALKAHFRTAKSRSSSTVTTAPEMYSSKGSGEAPVHEPSEQLLC